MEIMQISELAHSGMQFERTRLELAALKLSLMSMSFSSEVEAKSFVEQLLNKNDSINSTSSESLGLDIEKVKDVANPSAGPNGYIYKYLVDPTHEMSTLVSATRAYEANVRAYNANSDMNKAALDIGVK